jgi:hypothetical protein
MPSTESLRPGAAPARCGILSHELVGVTNSTYVTA